MSPLAEAVIILTAKYGPAFVQGIITIAHKADPTLADWQAVFDLAKEPIADVSDIPNKQP